MCIDLPAPMAALLSALLVLGCESEAPATPADAGADGGADAGSDVGAAPTVEHDPDIDTPPAAPNAEGRISVPAGIVRAGSLPGTPHRRPGIEADLVEVELGPYEIDARLRRDDDGQLVRVASQAEASSLCASDGARLCHELEWERACEGDEGHRYATGETLERERCLDDPAGCASSFGALELGWLEAEWTASEATERLARLGIATVVRGAPGGADLARSRCAARAPHPPTGGRALPFRCCRGEAPTEPYPSVGLRRPFSDLDHDDDRWREILTSIPELRAYAGNFRAYGQEDAARALGRGGASEEDMQWELAPGPFSWSPTPGEEVWVLAGRSGDTGLLAALYPLPDGRFIHAASFLFAGEPVPLAILRARSSRSELIWSACWACAGEGGIFRLEEDARVQIIQQ